jgi:predicted O-methyltransferase YrrM
MNEVAARHKELSVISSMDDDPYHSNRRLIDLAVAAARLAADIELRQLDLRSSQETRWYRTWPGEHYRLLAALVEVLDARTVIEVGTFTGMGALALAERLPLDGGIITFDLLPWTGFQQTWLAESDFENGRIRQVIGNIADGIEPYKDLFQQADFIFIDGPKDGVTEPRFAEAIASIDLPRDPIVMFDDIRVLNVVDFWRRLQRPKLDLTSFGHWSGTGLVDWNGKP